jgi:hypothetical protein
MPKTRKETQPEAGIHLDWVTVKIRTLVFYGVMAFSILIGAVGIYLYFRYSGVSLQETALKSIESAEKVIHTAEQKVTGESFREDLDKAVEKLGEARSAFQAGDFEGAKQTAILAEKMASSIIQGSSYALSQARVVSVEGQVELQRAGQLDWLAARDGMGLTKGDRIRCATNASAEIRYVDGSTLVAKPGALMEIVESKQDSETGRTDVVTGVNAGGINVKTREYLVSGSTHEVKTPTSVATLSAQTALDIGYDPGEKVTDISVFSGQADVRAGEQKLTLATNENVRVDPAEKFTPKKKIPKIPMLFRPSHFKFFLLDSLRKGSLPFEWESVGQGVRYEFQCAATPLFTNPIIVAGKLRHSSYAGRFSEEGRYFWRVKAIDDKGLEGGYSAPYWFQISNVEPTGTPPRLEISSITAFGGGLVMVEGKTKPGVFVSVEGGDKVWQPFIDASGNFRKPVQFNEEGLHNLTIVARDSHGLESRVSRKVSIQFN